ncbi:hypothetical protein CPB97_001320 [Podila verticillata]|nr:hypothetical protein CPB97_001320 [Podila verticillata]
MKGLTLCPSIQYLTKVPSTSVAERRIQEYFDKMPSLSLQTPCLTALQDALCLLEFPKCAGQTQMTLPVCWSVRDRVAQLCYEPFNHEHPPSGPTSDQHVDGDEGITLEQIRDSLFTPSFNNRWAASASVQEPDCVSFSDHGVGASPLEDIQIVNDLGDQRFNEFKADQLEEEQRLKEQSAADLNADQSGLFENEDDDVEYYAEMESMKVKLLDRRSRVRRHHHHESSEGKKHKEKRSDNTSAAKANAKERAHIAIRADEPGQAVYTVHMGSGSEQVLAQQSLSHAETDKNSALDDHQRVLAQSGTNNASPSDATDALGKANAGHPVDTTKEAGESDEASHPKKGTVLLAAVPILLVMGAIAGFTVYRRYYENSFNQGGRNDTHDTIPGDDYHRRGSPIHFDRTFLNTIHSPPPTATYLHDPENNSRHQSPSSIASAGNMKRPPPSAGSHGKTRFQELSRSYDFGAGLRSIKNALSRSNNNSRDTLHKATSASGSNSSFNGKNQAFGAGGHSLAKISSHPGLNVLDRQQLQQQYGASGGPSGSGSGSRFPDIHNLVAQEHSIVWGQYSADDDGVYHDASATLASNLARKSVSSNSLSGGKYSHHHQRSSAHQPDTPTDSIGDCLSPESPSMSREELMRRREMFAPAYTFGSEGSAATDSHSGTDLLFDARDHFFDVGNEKALETQLHDEEMDMYLSMEKEESPYAVDDYNSMNPAPYEPKVLYRHALDSNIQKSAPMSEKEPVVRPSISIDRAVEEIFDEKAAMKALEEEEEEEEGTHVLGNASPEWSQTIGTEQEQAVDRLSANAAIGATAVALGSSMQASGSVEFDHAEWEEDPRSTSTASLATSGGGGSKGGKKKNKSKKGRKH